MFCTRCTVVTVYIEFEKEHVKKEMNATNCFCVHCSKSFSNSDREYSSSHQILLDIFIKTAVIFMFGGGGGGVGLFGECDVQKLT